MGDYHCDFGLVVSLEVDEFDHAAIDVSVYSGLNHGYFQRI